MDGIYFCVSLWASALMEARDMLNDLPRIMTLTASLIMNMPTAILTVSGS